ncbi:MAG: FAD-binding oxidoreductase, partial [Desulfohalobiaceae bacterium]|nr:FAD-binding oxidoreductase [Desulfohalobiaceae bacterium]
MTVNQLKKKLASLVGADNILASREDLLCYAYDATKRVHVPEIVVFPGSVQEVSGVFRIASQARVPVVPRGAGSGMTGGALAVQGGIVLAMNRFDRILEIDEDNLVAVVQPAVITGRLQRIVQEKGLFYPPDP